MKYGLSTTTVERLQNTLLHYPEVEKAVLYGSRAKGTYRPGSDIDLTLCGGELNHILLTQINNELDDLLLPYQIDLSLMASLSHPALLDHISRVGVVLYAKSSAPLEAYSFKNQSE
jgi:predicted nucleotidyltransferase